MAKLLKNMSFVALTTNTVMNGMEIKNNNIDIIKDLANNFKANNFMNKDMLNVIADLYNTKNESSEFSIDKINEIQKILNIEIKNNENIYDAIVKIDKNKKLNDNENFQYNDICDYDNSKFIGIKLNENIKNFKGLFENQPFKYFYFTNKFDDINVDDVSNMFKNCKDLERINVFNFPWDKIKNMSYMFYGCENLKSIMCPCENFFCFNTENVINMKCMFSGCSSLKSLDLSNFDTRNVNNMCNMFSGCKNLKEIKGLSNFNTSNVNNMFNMFCGCSSLSEIKLPNFNTENVENMRKMFYGCSSLKELNVSSFNTENVKDMNAMFSGCSSLKELNVSSFNTYNVTSIENMFCGCSSLEELNLSNFKTMYVENMSNIFYGCSSLKELNISSFNTFSMTNMEGMFSGCDNLKTLNDKVRDKKIINEIRNINEKKYGNLDYKQAVANGNIIIEAKLCPGAFEDIKAYIKDHGFKHNPFLNNDGKIFMYPVLVFNSNTKEQIKYDSIDNLRESMKDVTDITIVILDQLSNIDELFYKPYEDQDRQDDYVCYFVNNALRSVYDIYKSMVIKISSYTIKNANKMCANCTCLESVTFNTIKSDGMNCLEINNMEGMFIGCTSLESVKFPYKIKNVNYISYMFYLCEKLKSVDLSNLSTLYLKKLNNLVCSTGNKPDVIKLSYLNSDITVDDHLKHIIKIKDYNGNFISAGDYLEKNSNPFKIKH